MEFKTKPILLFVLLASVTAYFLLAYFIPRTYFAAVFCLYSVVFLAYIYLVGFPFSLKQGLLLALFFRLIFFVATPRLSDDYFRFIWDGTLLTHGQNPFRHQPSYYLQPQQAALVPALNPELYANLNSPHYYSLYPPVCQAVFGLANLFGGTNLWLNCFIMRLIILLAEAGSFFFLLRLLNWLRLPYSQLWWYAFNPLVIIELSGNLHPEGLLIFFLLGSIYLILKNNLFGSAGLMALAVGVKLWPLMFLPLVYKKLGFKNFLRYGTLVFLGLATLFLPFVSPDLAANIFKSINLYFRQFEFNAGIYYLLRWLGYRGWGYNLIAVIGPALSLVTVAGLLYLAFRQKRFTNQQFLQTLLFSFTLYLALATVVHPWYVSTLVALTTLTRWRYPILWSGLVFLSYATYATSAYTENFYFVAIEYIGLFGYLAYEWWVNTPPPTPTPPINAYN